MLRMVWLTFISGRRWECRVRFLLNRERATARTREMTIVPLREGKLLQNPIQQIKKELYYTCSRTPKTKLKPSLTGLVELPPLSLSTRLSIASYLLLPKGLLLHHQAPSLLPCCHAHHVADTQHSLASINCSDRLAVYIHQIETP